MKLEDIQTIFNTINKSKLERKGYILLPSFEGFELFEIHEDRLKLYLQAESLHNRVLVNTDNKNSILPILVVGKSCENCKFNNECRQKQFMPEGQKKCRFYIEHVC
jgi:hypothetical protein